jgi:hypothetical protein
MTGDFEDQRQQFLHAISVAETLKDLEWIERDVANFARGYVRMLDEMRTEIDDKQTFIVERDKPLED